MCGKLHTRVIVELYSSEVCPINFAKAHKAWPFCVPAVCIDRPISWEYVQSDEPLLLWWKSQIVAHVKQQHKAEVAPDVFGCNKFGYIPVFVPVKSRDH